MRDWLSRPVPMVLWLLTCAVIGLLLGWNLKISSRLSEVQSAQQASRVSSVEQICHLANSKSRDNIEFIEHDVHSSPEVRAKARARFKLTPDCLAFAIRTVNHPPQPKPPLR